MPIVHFFELIGHSFLVRFHPPVTSFNFGQQSGELLALLPPIAWVMGGSIFRSGLSALRPLRLNNLPLFDSAICRTYHQLDLCLSIGICVPCKSTRQALAVAALSPMAGSRRRSNPVLLPCSQPVVCSLQCAHMHAPTYIYAKAQTPAFVYVYGAVPKVDRVCDCDPTGWPCRP